MTITLRSTKGSRLTSTEIDANWNTLSGSGGAASVGFVQSGTGAVTRTVQEKERDIISVPDHATFANNLTAATGRRLYFPGSTSTQSAQNNVPASTTIVGDGRGSVLKTITTNMHLLGVLVAGVLIRGLSFLGVKGTTVLNNSAVSFSGATDCAVENSEASGMSGMAFYATLSDHIRIESNYVHGLTPDSGYVNSSDIAFYTTDSYCFALFNRLEGGAQTEVGVLLQLDSTKHLVLGNQIAAHYSYGIIDYDTTPRSTYNIIAFNRIEDIDGTSGGGSKGAGIYTVSNGLSLITGNQIRNTNINTSNETLAPGGIGINQPFSPLVIAQNIIDVANWFGIVIEASTGAIVGVYDNHIHEAVKGGFYAHSSSHVNLVGGSITQLTATPLTVRAVAVNVAGGGPFTGVSVIGQRIRGSSRGIEVGFTNNILVSGNNVSECNGIGIRITAGVGGTVSNNVADSTTSAASAALDVSGMQNCTYSGNVFNSQSTTCVSFAGVNTGSVFDETNIVSVSGVIGGMNNIDNTTAGCRVTQYGTAAPTVKTHQVGDRVINSAPGVGKPEYWDCTVAGLPGTWVPVNIMPAVSADRGNAAQTLVAGTDEPTQVWNTAITADRAVTLSTTGVWNGAKFRIIRTAAATGAFNLNVGTGPLKAMGTAGSFADVEYNGATAAWMLTGYGVL